MAWFPRCAQRGIWLFCIPNATWEEDHGYSWSCARWDHQSLCPAATQCLCAGNLQNFALHFGRLVRDFIQVGDYVQFACWHRSFLESNAWLQPRQQLWGGTACKSAARILNYVRQTQFAVRCPKICLNRASKPSMSCMGHLLSRFWARWRQRGAAPDSDCMSFEPAQKHGGSKVGAAQPCCKSASNMGHTSSAFGL